MEDQEKTNTIQNPEVVPDAMMKKEEPSDAMMKKETPMMTKEAGEGDAMMKQTETPMIIQTEDSKPDTMMKKDPSNDAIMQKETPVMMKKETGYQAYSESRVNAALKEGQKIYVFFHADWCPSCKALDADIEANLSLIPANTLVFKADYDSETALKQKYGVTVQTTVIALGTDGSLAKKTLGVTSLKALLQ